MAAEQRLAASYGRRHGKFRGRRPGALRDPITRAFKREREALRRRDERRIERAEGMAW
jgi:hypothetical protein